MKKLGLLFEAKLILVMKEDRYENYLYIFNNTNITVFNVLSLSIYVQ